MGLHVVLAACGPSAGEITDVRVSTCAEDGPALLEERFIAIAAWMVDERLVIGGFELDPDDDPPDDPYPELRSMGACGEAPSVLLRGKLDVRVVDDLLLACDESGRVNRIGPHGMRPPERLFERVSCRFETTSAGLIAHDPVQEAILLRPAPEQDGIEVVTLAEAVVDSTASCTENGCAGFHVREPYPFHVIDDHVYAVDTTSRLLQIDLDATATVVATEVAEVQLPARGDLLVIETLVVDEDGERVVGPISSWDPATGASVAIDLTSPWIDWPFAIGRRPSDDVDWRIFVAVDLRDGSEVLLPETSASFSKPRQGRHFSFSSGGLLDNTHWLWSDERRQWVDLGHYPGCSVAVERDEHVEILVHDCDPREAWHANLGEVWLVDFEGRQRLGATSVSSNRFSTPERVVWSVFTHTNEVAGWFGDLLVSEAGDGERWRIDRHALLHVNGLVPALDLNGDILYTVRDGSRTGLWRSALP
jgi:hypothetical protein